MTYRPFVNDEESHQHSLGVLESLYEFDDFMESINTLADFGSGAEGLDIEWWATRTTRDELQEPLNIKCTAVDTIETCRAAGRNKNVTYLRQDLEQPFPSTVPKFDVIWSHDTLQYLINPYQALVHWREAAQPGGMLVVVLPQMVEMDGYMRAFDQWDHCLYPWTMVSLIHHLAMAGWDCSQGFFKKDPDDPWLHAIAYRGDKGPFDPRKTRWYDLCNAGVLPETMVKGITQYGHARERDLVLPWVDRSIRWLGKH